MNTEKINKMLPKKNNKIPNIKIGDKVTLGLRIKEKDKERVQLFKGMVIAQNGSGQTKSITVRKISYGIGVEKIIPIYSEMVDHIKVESHSKVRRSKLYYMRERIGKKAMKLKSGASIEATKTETQKDNESDKENKK